MKKIVKKLVFYSSMLSIMATGCSLKKEDKNFVDSKPTYKTEETTVEDQDIYTEDTLDDIISKYNESSGEDITKDDIEVTHYNDYPMYVWKDANNNYIYDARGKEGYTFHEESNNSGNAYIVKRSEETVNGKYLTPIAGLYYDFNTDVVNIKAATFDGTNYHEPSPYYVEIENPTKDNVDDLEKFIQNRTNNKSIN